MWPLQKKNPSLFTNVLPTEYCLESFYVETHVSLAKLVVCHGRHLHFERNEHIVCICREQLFWESVKLHTAPNPIIVLCRCKARIFYTAWNQCNVYKQCYLINKWFLTVIRRGREYTGMLDTSLNTIEVIQMLWWFLRNSVKYNSPCL